MIRVMNYMGKRFGNGGIEFFLTNVSTNMTDRGG